MGIREIFIGSSLSIRSFSHFGSSASVGYALWIGECLSLTDSLSIQGSRAGEQQLFVGYAASFGSTVPPQCQLCVLCHIFLSCLTCSAISSGLFSGRLPLRNRLKQGIMALSQLDWISSKCYRYLVSNCMIVPATEEELIESFSIQVLTADATQVVPKQFLLRV